MKFYVDPSDIIPVLTICSKIADAKGGLSSYGSVLLEAKLNDPDGNAGVVKVSAMDGDKSFTGTVEATRITTEGSVAVDCNKFLSVFKTRIQGHDVEVQTKGESAVGVKQGEFKASLPAYQGFPSTAVDVDDAIFSMALNDEFLNNLVKCAGAVDMKSEKLALRGLLLDFSEEGRLWVVGMSSPCAHVYTKEIEGKFPPFRCVISPSSFPIMAALLKDHEVTIFFDPEKGKVIVNSDSAVLTLSCMEDKYPIGYIDIFGLQNMFEGKFYHKAFDGDEEELEPKTPIKFETVDFLGALESASSVLGIDDVSVELKREDRLADGKGVAELTGQNPMTNAKASEKILVEDQLDRPFTIYLHSERIYKTVSKFENDNFTMFVRGSRDWIHITEDGTPDFVALTSPLWE